MVNILNILEHQKNKTIAVHSEIYDICRAILRQRQKKRSEGLDVFLSFVRVLMLAKSLKFIRYDNNLFKIDIFINN